MKLTPVEWKIAGVISSGDNLEPRISMRAGVLASPESATPFDQAPAPGFLPHAPLPEGGALQCVFNLSRGAVWCAGTAPPDAALAGPVHLRGASGATRLAGELRAGAGDASSRLDMLDEWLDAEVAYGLYLLWLYLLWHWLCLLRLWLCLLRLWLYLLRLWLCLLRLYFTTHLTSGSTRR